jgi:peptidoglycan/LPS O-acetylase OafA/YrhL
LSAPRFLDRFRRVTSSGGFIAEIDGLRFIAIGAVILFHLAVNLSAKAPLTYGLAGNAHWMTWITHHGSRGVELFFIISGFILALPFASQYLLGERRVRLGQYFLRRVTRLEPPYIVSMLFFFLVAITLKGASATDLIPHLLASLTYLHNLIFRSESLINNVAWSLEIEIQFYILVPLLANIFRIRSKVFRRSLIVALALLTIINEWLFIDPTHILYLTIVRFLHFFLLGFLLADVYLLDWNKMPRQSFSWDFVSFIGWPVLFIVWNHPEISAFADRGTVPLITAVVFPALAFLLYCAIFLGRISNTIMTNRWITTIGGMCYTIYLFHNQLLGLLLRGTSQFAPTNDYNVNVLLQGLFVIPPLLVLSAIYFALIERPCMQKDWPRKLKDWALSRFGRQKPIE